MSKDLRSDSELLSGVSVGTFRWKKNKTFLTLPTPEPTTTYALNGWGPYLTARAGPAFLFQVQEDLATIDALSFPLSLLFALNRLTLTPSTLQQQGITDLHLIVAGATAHAEQRLLFDTNYWAEIGHVYKDVARIHLHFVGPEAASRTTLEKTYTTKSLPNKKSGKKRNKRKHKPLQPRVASNTTVTHFVGPTTDFLQQHAHLIERDEEETEGHLSRATHTTVMVGFNPGFGSGNGPIVGSWTSDLLKIMHHHVPIVFTQANDYSDLRGELLVLQKIVGTKFVMTPLRNPFPMATVAQEPNKLESWSCGNSFLYSVQGYVNKEAVRRSMVYMKEPKTLARNLAQVVTLQRQMDLRGGALPGKGRGSGGMSKIQMLTEEVGTLNMNWMHRSERSGKRRVAANDVDARKVRVGEGGKGGKGGKGVKGGDGGAGEKGDTVVSPPVATAHVAKSKGKEKETTATKETSKARTHRLFMEGLGRTAKERGFMPDMNAIEAYKEEEQVRKATVPVAALAPELHSTMHQPVAVKTELETGSNGRRVAVPEFALELDY
jgi:hypothetical protein